MTLKKFFIQSGLLLLVALSLLRIFLFFGQSYHATLSLEETVEVFIRGIAGDIFFVILFIFITLLLLALPLGRSESVVKVKLFFVVGLKSLLICFLFFDALVMYFHEVHIAYNLNYVFYLKHFAGNSWPYAIMVIAAGGIYGYVELTLIRRLKFTGKTLLNSWALTAVAVLVTIFGWFNFSTATTSFEIQQLALNPLFNYFNSSCKLNLETIEDLASLTQPLFPPDSRYVFLGEEYPMVKATPSDKCRLFPLGKECAEDNDGDGFELKNDCNDQEAQINPKALDIPSNGIDEDCSGSDENLPNIILIFMESVGYPFLQEKTMPFLTKLSRENYSFTNYYSNGNETSRAVLSGLCSVLPRNGFPEIAELENIDLLCLPEILNEHGYRSVEMQAGDLDFLNKRPFFEKIGFQEMYGSTDFDYEITKGSWGVTDSQLYREVQTMAGNLGQPFFMTLFTLALHYPHNIPTDHKVQQFSDDSFTNTVLNLVNYTDASLQNFFESSKNETWFQNSIVVITSDNAHPVGWHPNNSYNYSGLYEENIHIPLVVVDNRKQAVSQQNHVVGSHVDLAPTVLDLLDIHPLNHFQGSSLFNEPSERNKFTFALAQGPDCLVAIRDDSFKLIDRHQTQLGDLYDYLKDPTEAHVLENDDVKSKLRQAASQIFWSQQALYQTDKFWSPELTKQFLQLIDAKKVE